MDLVYIYGPPSAGKLTVATEIARRTGFKLFHNHLTIAAVEPVFGFGTDPFWRLVHGMRERILAEAALAGISLVFTTVYNHPGSIPQTLRRFDAVEQHGGRVCLVKLTCSIDALEERVTAVHRPEMGKIARVEKLRETIAEFDVLSPIPGRESFSIDNTDVPAIEVASMILERFGLTSAQYPGLNPGA